MPSRSLHTSVGMYGCDRCLVAWNADELGPFCWIPKCRARGRPKGDFWTRHYLAPNHYWTP